MMNPHLCLNGSFAPTMPQPGSIAFLSQSGALGVAILDFAAEHDMGFSKFLSVGNQAGVDEAELLEYLANDPNTKVILLYIEQLSELTNILRVAQKIRRTRHPKPIIALKSGQTQRGAQAASSHTGALASNDAVYDALFRQAGILRAETVEDLFLFAECFVYNKLLKKDRVAIVTNAGGLGVLTTDALAREELNLAEFSVSTKKALQKILPPAASIHNPVDILGDAPAQRYKDVLDLVIKDDNVDAVAVLLTPQSMTEVEKTADILVQTRKKTSKPLIVSFLGGARVTKGLDILEKGQLAQASFPELAAEALAALYEFTLWKKRTKKPERFDDFNTKKLEKILNKKNVDPDGWLSSEAALELLTACQIQVPRWQLVSSLPQLKTAISSCGPTVVLKLAGSSGLHKSDLGGVMLNVTVENAEESYEAFLKNISKSVKEKNPEMLVMEQVSQKGNEVILGAIRDQKLGVLVGCGMGGVYTEVFHDAAFNLAPLAPDDIEDILERLKITAVLKGARGGKVADISELKESLARISQLVIHYPQISELDLNPLLVFPRGKGVIALDVRIKCVFD
jgi:acetyltransferase